MKVTNEMIAPEFRTAGKMIRPITNLLLRKKRPYKNSLKRKKRSLRKNNGRNIYISRKDKSQLRLMIMKPQKREKNCTGVLWIHGGGYALGMPEMACMSMARFLAEECLLVLPDYTLSATAPYPAALNDCYQALLWMRDHAKELEIDPDKIMVGGESAGGGLAIAVCMMARDRGDMKIACQMPLYPMIDDRMNTPSMVDNDAPVWNEKNSRKAWELYKGNLAGDCVPKYLAPSRETDYSDLPPAITFVGSLDPFFDETMSYVENLKQAGVPVACYCCKGGFHAFDMIVPGADKSKKAVEFFLRNFHKISSGGDTHE